MLPAEPYENLASYVADGGGKGLADARLIAPDTVIDELDASGLRGRGGAGFPTGVKWRTVRSYASPLLHTTVIVNAAEGEPGTFKDRTLLRLNPYAVVEGALIAALAVDAQQVVIALKASFTQELVRLRGAIAEISAAGWSHGVTVDVLEGPSEYLFGEETALLEVIDGRPPFPRIAPPFRRGVVEVVSSADDASSGSGLAADVQMAEEQGQSIAPPVLVNNVETMANVPAIIARGAAWFREMGTEDSPGTIMCTITGAVRTPGVIEVPMGTPLRDVIEMVGGMQQGRALRSVLVGVSNAAIGPDDLDVPLTYEAMAAIGSGLGSAGFIVIGDDVEPISIAAGAARFLSIESCGQCTHCKQDGSEIADLLAKLAAGDGRPVDLELVHTRLGTVAEGARCSLGRQQETVIGSLLTTFDESISARATAAAEPVEVLLVAALVDIDEQGAVLDESFLRKQPDWTHDEVDSGKAPVDRFTDHRAD